MTEKTNVTKDPVSESGKPGSNPSDEGKSPSEKDLENKIRENLRAEYERREQILSDKLSEAEEKLAEKGDDLSEDLERMDHSEDRSVRLWVRKSQLEAEKAVETAKQLALNEFYDSQIREWIEDKAEELKMEYKDLRKAINPYAAQYLDSEKYSPMKRLKLAFGDWEKSKKLDERETELKKREEESYKFSENGGRSPTETTLEDDLTRGDNISAMKKLGL